MFRKNKTLTIEERKWNLMWNMWVEDNAASPYAELMQYDSEVNNGGHFQYFINGTLMGNMNEQIDVVLKNLPQPLHNNLKEAYNTFCDIQNCDNTEDTLDAYFALEDLCDPRKIEKFLEYDKFFYENEHVIIAILKTYANELNLDT